MYIFRLRRYICHADIGLRDVLWRHTSADEIWCCESTWCVCLLLPGRLEVHLESWGVRGGRKIAASDITQRLKGTRSAGRNDNVELISPFSAFCSLVKGSFNSARPEQYVCFCVGSCCRARATSLFVLWSVQTQEQLSCVGGAFKTRTLKNDPGVHRC